MSEFKENSVLQTLTTIFNSYLSREITENRENKVISKKTLIQIFYDFNVLDTCEYNVLHLNEFLHQLSPDTDTIDLKKYLMLIFFIYKNQIKGEEDESEVNDVTTEEVNDISDNRREIAERSNIVKIFLEDYELGKKYFRFCVPSLDNPYFKEILNYDVIDNVSKYMYSFNEEIFTKYNSEQKEKKILYFNIVKLNSFFISSHISSVFKGTELTNFVQVFTKFELKHDSIREEFAGFCDTPMTEQRINDLFENYFSPTKDLNFSYSSILLMVTIMAFNLETTKDAPYSEKIKFFFEDILHLKRDDADLLTEKIEEEKQEDTIDDTLPESETLNKAKSKTSYTKDDIDLIHEFLLSLDKVLPPENENVLNFANEYPNLSTSLYTNNNDNKKNNKKTESKKFDNKTPLFPVEKLMVEITEEKERQMNEKEQKQIAKAKKVKKQDKSKTVRPYDAIHDELIDQSKNDLRYMGKEIVYTLTNRLIKNTYKEILPNSEVYPTIIKEVLMIPPSCSQKCMELIVESMEDRVEGHYETAIKRLEKAQEFIPKDINKLDWQKDLFFNLSYGSIYDTLGYDIIALKYYAEACHISEKLISADPDNALCFCFLGEFFVKIREFNWALRAFLQAKKIREETIGGDTPDTATIYNNLGVVSYCLESYLPANGYFKLAYEIYKNLLGLTHPRTMMIKANITKMNQLNFNREVQFKTLSMYPTPALMIQNPAKKKK